MRTLVGIGLVAAAALAALALASAQGASDAAGSLATGGTAKGDISPTPGEFDTIGVNLEQGSRVNVKWNSGFAATVAFLAPSGQPITIGFDSTRSASLRAWTVPETGRYEFRVAGGEAENREYLLSCLAVLKILPAADDFEQLVHRLAVAAAACMQVRKRKALGKTLREVKPNC